ncbi:MAG: YggT family protein [Desulfarculus sp.]|nr:YggT family protein [Pseudomonadota bacterium]MBV1717187.1 YggT family protein [Desulfarculus sp.]MBU4576669.1 YggT family protein [Pseudomonadota bacterium]MBU4598413.1 YggT family protein [Pseudomonadota bacterium]MBV1739477.1 YggT family protein [Desulfarculus sp.]
MIFFLKILQFISWLLGAYMWVIVASAVITWVRPDPGNPIVRFLFAVTEPVLWRVRRIIPTNFGGFDIAPVILILAIIFLQNVVIAGLMSLIVGSAMNIQ